MWVYAGHGLQVAGQNFLLPIDAQLSSASALEFEAIRLDLVHRVMEREAKTNILFIDACRNNPLARNLARAMGTRSTEIGRGLAAIEAGAGTLISFSTQPGNVALDGTGRNSPFAGALANYVSTSSDDLGAILIAVRNDVMRDTGRKQVPWEHSALTGRVFCKPSKAAEPPRELQVELAFWASVFPRRVALKVSPQHRRVGGVLVQRYAHCDARLTCARLLHDARLLAAKSLDVAQIHRSRCLTSPAAIRAHLPYVNRHLTGES